MGSPKISVLIPAYNSGRFIERVLRRVLRQSLPAHEIIVVDDGSTDGTWRILQDFGPGIRIKKTPNAGSAAARNEAARMATGDTLAFLDADDFWFTKKLRVFSEYLEKFPAVDFFCSDYLIRSDKAGRVVRHYENLPNFRRFNFNALLKERPFGLLLDRNFVGTASAVVVRKPLFEALGGFDPECRIVEDLNFFFQAATRTDFVLIREALLYKHTHERNVSLDKIETLQRHAEMLERAVKTHEAYIRQRGLSDRAAMGRARVEYALGALHFDAGDKKEAFRLYGEALKLCPTLSNLLRFLWETGKKAARVLTNDALRRKNLKKIFRP